MKTSPSLLVLTLALAVAAPATQAAAPHAVRSSAAAPRALIGAALGDAGTGAFAATDAKAGPSAPRAFTEALAAQKMLAQRVVQTYARTGVQGDPAAGATQLAVAAEDFSAGLAALEASLPGEPPRAGTQDPVRQSVWMLAGQWADAQAVIAEQPTIHSALRLAGKMDGALGTIDRLGVELADWSDPTASTSIGALLTRQAELSQRIARAYWLRRLGDDSAAGRHELEAAERAMRANLAMLKTHPDRDAHSAVALERIETEVDWLLAAVENDGAASYPLVVSAAAEQVVAQVADFGTKLVVASR